MSNPIMEFFKYEHLPQHLQTVSKPIGDLARMYDAMIPDSAEKTAGLRKLLEAKDCLERSAIGVDVKPLVERRILHVTVDSELNQREIDRIKNLFLGASLSNGTVITGSNVKCEVESVIGDAKLQVVTAVVKSLDSDDSED